MKPLGISHVGIVVLDLERAVTDYCSIFEFDSIERVSMESEGVNIALLKTGESEIELLSPAKDGSSVSKFLKERGEGIHHVAIRIESVKEAIARAKALGMKVLDEKPKRGARGAHAAFVHPKSFHGVLLEFYDR